MGVSIGVREYINCIHRTRLFNLDTAVWASEHEGVWIEQTLVAFHANLIVFA